MFGTVTMKACILAYIGKIMNKVCFILVTIGGENGFTSILLKHSQMDIVWELWAHLHQDRNLTSAETAMMTKLKQNVHLEIIGGMYGIRGLKRVPMHMIGHPLYQHLRVQVSILITMVHRYGRIIGKLLFQTSNVIYAIIAPQDTITQQLYLFQVARVHIWTCIMKMVQ
tara:strand:- start:13616 stop:14122 length:507 start_codon:yes stop_codon:yes gene_type:complete